MSGIKEILSTRSLNPPENPCGYRLPSAPFDHKISGCSYFLTLIRISVPFSISWYHLIVDTMHDKSTWNKFPEKLWLNQDYLIIANWQLTQSFDNWWEPHRVLWAADNKSQLENVIVKYWILFTAECGEMIWEVDSHLWMLLTLQLKVTLSPSLTDLLPISLVSITGTPQVFTETHNII